MKEPESQIRIMIADDHWLVLDGIVSLLEREKGIIVADTARDGRDALALMKENDYDVCLLDINMPNLDGLGAVREIKKLKPSCRILMLTTYNDEAIITELLHLGVAGYVLKNSSRHELVNAIRKVAIGESYFSDDVGQTLIRSIQGNALHNRRNESGSVTLTKRETEIVKLLAREYTNERIAGELNISYRTVETHRKNIMHKTESRNLAGLLKFAYSRGIID